MFRQKQTIKYIFVKKFSKHENIFYKIAFIFEKMGVLLSVSAHKGEKLCVKVQFSFQKGTILLAKH